MNMLSSDASWRHALSISSVAMLTHGGLSVTFVPGVMP